MASVGLGRFQFPHFSVAWGRDPVSSFFPLIYIFVIINSSPSLFFIYLTPRRDRARLYYFPSPLEAGKSSSPPFPSAGWNSEREFPSFPWFLPLGHAVSVGGTNQNLFSPLFGLEGDGPASLPPNTEGRNAPITVLTPCNPNNGWNHALSFSAGEPKRLPPPSSSRKENFPPSKPPPNGFFFWGTAIGFFPFPL